MTTGFILLKELAVPTIAVFLTRLMRTYWAQVLETRSPNLSRTYMCTTRQLHHLQLHFGNDVVCDYSITQLLTTELSTYPLSRASPAPPSVSPPPVHSLPSAPLTIDQNTVSITASPSAISSCAVVSNVLSV
ncbi:unnamed protein product [Colletotrichum noveboracense]|uniref:Uncharacterized protein n=1 Tax=Colletotrichum noveboracense TaxID=2664923 RepID=A0A9W4S6N3_9PEZI|nr:unnamed protein product [Colletotrichum noveboracense]